MKRTVAGVIILSLLGVLLAPAGTALASTGGSFTINALWVWTDSGAPKIPLTLSPGPGMTRVAIAVGYDYSSSTGFADSDFEPIQSTQVQVFGPSKSHGYDGLIKVWVQYESASGSRSDLLMKTVPAYSWLHITIQDSSGAPFNSVLADPAGHDKPLVIHLTMGGYGQAALSQGTWGVTVTNPLTNDSVSAPVDLTTQKAQITIPAGFLTTPQRLTMQVIFNGGEVWHRDLQVETPEGVGLIQMTAQGLTPHYDAWVTACNVDTGRVYHLDETQFPASLAVPAGTYRVEALIMDEGADQWALYPSQTVTLKMGQVVQSPVFDTAASVVLDMNNKATYAGTPLPYAEAQFRPIGIKGRTGIDVSLLPLLRTHITPGTYTPLMAFQKSIDQPDNNVYIAEQYGVDVTKTFTFSDDFADTSKYSVLTLKGLDGKGGPAPVWLQPTGSYFYSWASDEVGETFIHLQKATYSSWTRVGAATSDRLPYFWILKKMDLSTDQTVTIGGPLTLSLTGTNVAPGKEATVTVTVTDSFGNRVDSANANIETLVFKDGTGRVLLSAPTYSFAPFIYTIPSDAVLPIRVVVKLDTQEYQGVLTTEAVFGAPTFADIAPVAWAKPAIQLMAAKGVAKGTGGGNFGPMGTVTRAEFATFLVRALGLSPETANGRFSDVQPTDWFDGYVGAAAKAGLTRETNGPFRPTDFITRQEMADMMARALNFKGKGITLTNLQVDDALAGFSDAADVADWARENIAAAAKAGLLKGKNGGRIAPLENATRAEAAVILERLLDYTGDL